MGDPEQVVLPVQRPGRSRGSRYGWRPGSHIAACTLSATLTSQPLPLKKRDPCRATVFSGAGSHRDSHHRASTDIGLSNNLCHFPKKMGLPVLGDWRGWGVCPSPELCLDHPK